MYRKPDKQIFLDDFDQIFGWTIDPDNRWVKKAKLIQWDDIEKEYSSRFPSKVGQVAKSARLALGALLIQKELGLSDVETVLMIQEHPYLQYFCGMRAYTHEIPFDPSLMVHFRKRFTPELLAAINEKIIERSTPVKLREEVRSSKDKDAPPNAVETPRADERIDSRNSAPPGPDAVSDAQPPEETPTPNGTLIVDATCVPSGIKYPTDTDLLNNARLDTERMISAMHDPSEGHRPRTYSRIARKEYVNFSKKRTKKAKEIRRMIFKQLNYLKRNLRFIDSMLKSGRKLSEKQMSRLEVVRKVYEQQKFMYDTKTHTVPDRIVSLSQPWIRPIVRGKTKTPAEFGEKIDVSVVNGFTRLEKTSFSAYNESGELIPEIERYRERMGFYPARVLADKIYRNRENLKYCKERGIRLSGPSLGRRPKDYVPDKKQDYKDMCDRNEVERIFSLAKRSYGLGIVQTRLPETVMCSISLSILLLNLNKVLFCTFILALFARLSTIRGTNQVTRRHQYDMITQ